MHTFRRHNPTQCKFTSREERRCKCPIWVVGRDRDGLFVKKPLHKFLRHPTFIRDWTKAQEDLRLYELGEKDRNHSITISEWRDKFLNDCKNRNLSEETVRKYKLLFSQLEGYAQIKGIAVADRIRLDDLTEFRSTWKDGPLSSSKKLERLRSIYRFALKRKWVKENLAAEIKTPKVPDNPTLPFSDDEMKAILSAAKQSKRFAAEATYAFILLMRYSGLRISDATTLRRDSIVERRLTLYTAKTGQPVSMLLPNSVAVALSKVVSKNPDYFFWTGKSSRASATGVWHERLADVFKDAKIVNGHSHRFRDTFAVSLLASGVSMQDVSTLLGHRNIAITQKHYSPWDQTRQAALDKALAKVQISIPA
jgi:site-specific recombinase XerD